MNTTVEKIDYLAEARVYATRDAQTCAQIAIAETLRDLVHLVTALNEELKNAGVIVSPAGDVRAAALEIEANIAYLEDKAAQGSIVDCVSAIIAKHVYPAGLKVSRRPTFTASDGSQIVPTGQSGQFTVVSAAVNEKGTVTVPAREADPFAGVCNRCGWEFKHIAHDLQYGSHKFEPSQFKTIAEWREANKLPKVDPNG